jgi:hypothetical protein
MEGKSPVKSSPGYDWRFRLAYWSMPFSVIGAALARDHEQPVLMAALFAAFFAAALYCWRVSGERERRQQ